MTTQKTESQIRNEVFASYLKQTKGEKLNANDRANIEAWELAKKHSQCEDRCEVKTDGKTSWVESLDPMNISDEELLKCDKAISKLHSENRALYNQAFKVVKQLKIDGAWRGCGARILIVANAIKGIDKEVTN